MTIFIICLSLILSAFFSGMEIALISSNRIDVEIEKNKSGFSSKYLAILTKNPSEFITTMLIGNSLSLVIFSYFMGKSIINTFFPQYIVLIDIPLYITLLQSFISTGLIFVIAEFLPKVFFQIYSNTFLKIFAIPAYVFYFLLYPIVRVIIWFSEKAFKTLSGNNRSKDKKLVFTKFEIEYYIKEEIDKHKDDKKVDTDVLIFKNALRFSELKAREAMVPRAEIVAVELHEKIDHVKNIFIKSGLSRILVYQESIDNIVGYIHYFDFIKKPKNIEEIKIPIQVFAESVLVKEALSKLTKKRKSIALVVDEYGGTSGVITIEDIIEELFGEIRDEHEHYDSLHEKKIEDNVFEFSGRLEIDYINQKYHLEIPKKEGYETLSGLIVSINGDIPENDEVFLFKNQFEFTVLDASDKKVNTVLVKKIS